MEVLRRASLAVMEEGHPDAVIGMSIEAACPICYEEFNNRKKRQRVRIDGCGHEVCLGCLVAHCKIAIQENNVPVPCPDVMGSHHFLQAEFVRSILTEEPSSKTTLGLNKISNIETAFAVQMPRANHNMRMDGPPTNTTDLEKGEYPTIEFNRTFSTQSSSTKGSKVSVSSGSTGRSSSSLSISSLQGYWNKYLRFQRLKEDPTLIPCPACEELVSPPTKVEVENETIEIVNNTNTQSAGGEGEDDVKTESLPYPQVACPSCKHCFCAIHGDAHNGMICSEFALTERGIDLDENEGAVLAMTKGCSHGCGARIARVSGCDHIICTHCNQDMCWKCGTHIFLTGKVIRSCSNCRQGFVDHRHYPEYRLRLLVTLPFHLALSAVYFAIIAVVVAVTCGFGCCFACGTRGWYFEPSESKDIRPRKGCAMGASIVCLPIIEIVRDCGWMPHNPEDDHD